MQWSEREITSFDVAGLKPSINEGMWLNVAEVLPTRFVLFNQGVLIRREVVDRIGSFDESLRFLEDHELSLRLSLDGPWAFIRDPLVIWRETPGSCYKQATENRHMLETKPWVYILEKHLTIVTSDERHTRLRKRVAGEVYRAHRQMQANKMTQMNSWPVCAVGRVLHMLERYRTGLFRRSPWFPKMKVASADGSTAKHERVSTATST